MQKGTKTRNNKLIFRHAVRCCVFVALMAGFALDARSVLAATGNLFLPYKAVKTGSWPAAVAIADLNGDGKKDVAMITSIYNDPVNDATLFVFLQDQAGQLQPPVKYYIGGRPESIAVGDVNGDGKNDVVVGNSNINQIGVFTQNTAGTLDAVVTYSTTNSRFVKTGDFNNDGKIDVVAMGWGSNSVDVFLQNASGVLSASVTYDVTHAGYDEVETGDVNSDGLTDIVVMSGQGYVSNLGVLLQQPDGKMSAPLYYDLGGNELTHGVAIGDLNGDALNDIVVSYGGNKPSSFIGVFQQNGAGTLNSAATYASYDVPESIETVDINGDGKKDVITVHGGWTKLGVYLQAGDGSLLPEDLYDIPYASHYNPQGLALGDINGDGVPDAVIADYNNGLVLLYGTQKIPQLVASPAALTFAATLPGAVSKQSLTFSNAGTGILSVTQLQLTGSEDFSLGQPATGGCGPLPLSIGPGSSCSLEVIFAPLASGTNTASLSISSTDADSPITTLQLSGFSPVPTPAINVTPSSVMFPSVPLGSAVTKWVLVSNVGTANLNLLKMEMTGLQASEFSLVEPSGTDCGLLPKALLPGESCTISIAFKPATSGSKAAALAVSSSDPFFPVDTLELSGSSPLPVPAISVSPASVDFPSVPWGSTAQQTVQIANTGTTDLTVTKIEFPGNQSSEFALNDPAAGGCGVLPKVLPPGSACSINVSFSPATSGPNSAYFVVSSSDQVSPNKSVQVSGFSPVADGVPVFNDDVESGGVKWLSVSGLWHVNESTSPYTNRHSGTRSWWYGQETTGNYDAGQNRGELVTVLFTVPANGKLSFWSWEQTEGGTYYDKRTVLISTDYGATWSQVYASADNSAAWRQVNVDLSRYAGSLVQIKFLFDTVDGAVNSYRGWYIDDIVVASAIAPPTPAGFSDDIESGAAKWESASGLWHIPATGTAYSKPHGGTKSWWYGRDATGNYSTGAANKGELVTTPFVVASGSRLTFWSSEQTEGGTYYDKRLVYISTNNGTTWTQIFQSTDNSSLWHQVTVSLAAYAGSTVKIKFVFDTVDSVANTYRGWYIDDVVVAP